mgnify:CR=1 FL=1
MITQILIVDINLSDDAKLILNAIKNKGTKIFAYDFKKGFIIEKNTNFRKELQRFINVNMETGTLQLQHFGILNFEQMNAYSYSYLSNSGYVLSTDIDDMVGPELVKKHYFMDSFARYIKKVYGFENIDFIDINHLYFPKEFELVLNHVDVNYFKISDNQKHIIKCSDNWLHTAFTKFYEGDNKVIIDKYFKISNTNLEFLKKSNSFKVNSFTPHNNSSLQLDLDANKLNICIIPLFGHTCENDVHILNNMIGLVSENTFLEFVNPSETEQDFCSRLQKEFESIYGDNRNYIEQINFCLWFNPGVSNSFLKLSNMFDSNIDANITTVVKECRGNQRKDIGILKSHFIVKMIELLVECFQLNIFNNTNVPVINFEMFNISESTSINYNTFSHFLQNDYFVSTIVNFNSTISSHVDVSHNLFELSLPSDTSQNIFKDLYTWNISRSKIITQYDNDVNIATYLKTNGNENEQLIQSNIIPNVITNVILYDMELETHLSDVRDCVLSNTLLLTFDKRNTYENIKDGLKAINKLDSVQITNIALFQDNDSRSKTYNLVNEETCIVKYAPINDPSLNTWSKFQDFVMFLEADMNIKYLDLMMCKIYSNNNWKYVIDSISSNLASLEIRSSENITGHTIFEGDWILESPLNDVNMIGLYFKESIKETSIHLGTLYPSSSHYTKVGRMKSEYIWVDGEDVRHDGQWFMIRCPMYQGPNTTFSDYSFPVPNEHTLASTPPYFMGEFTINFDNSVNVLVSQTGWANSYNYSDTITATGFVQKTHNQSPGNLYVSFDDETSIDNDTWFIPVNSIWNGANHSTSSTGINITHLSHTNYWTTEDFSKYETIFGTTFPTAHQNIHGTTMYDSYKNVDLYVYVGPYTAYSGIENPLPSLSYNGYNRIGWMKSEYVWVDGNYIRHDGQWLAIRCPMYQGTNTTFSDYSFPVPNEHKLSSSAEEEYTINFDNSVNVLVSQSGWFNSFNYSNTITHGRGLSSDTVISPSLMQIPHDQSPGNLYVTFDVSPNENTWFIPVNSIWNGANLSPTNINLLSDTKYWTTQDFSNFQTTFGTFPTLHQNISEDQYASYRDVNLYFYEGPYTIYSGIPNPISIVSDSLRPKFINVFTNEDISSTQMTLPIGSINATKESYVFTEDSSVFLNFDISAEIKEYIVGSWDAKDGDYTAVFNSSSTFTLPQDSVVDILIVGGGGAGGSLYGGGGGAGGVIYTVNQDISAGTYNIVVGAGGLGVQWSSVTDDISTNSGEDSYITDSEGNVISMFMGGVSQELRGLGGGGGGRYVGVNDPKNGISGGSGGGGAATEIFPDGSTAVRDSTSGDKGLAIQGNTFWDGSYYVKGGSDSNLPDSQVWSYNSAGGGGLSGNTTVTTTISGDFLLNQINGQDGVTIPINGGVTVAAGGGGSQSMWDLEMLRKNAHYPNNTITEGTTTLVGVGGSGIGGDGAVWQSGNPTEDGGWDSASENGMDGGTIDSYSTDAASNTGSGGGGWSRTILDLTAEESTLYSSANTHFGVSRGGSGGSGIVIIRVVPQTLNIPSGFYNININNSGSTADISVNLNTNTITSNVDIAINYVVNDISLSSLTNDLTILPSSPGTIPFVKSTGNQEERNVTLYGEVTYNELLNEYYFPGDLSGYASIDGQLFGDSKMSMSFMYKSGGSQPVFETNNGNIIRNTIAYIGQLQPSYINQNLYNTNDFGIYASPNDKSSIFYKEDEASIEDISSSIFDNSSNYTHIVITMNEDLTLSETDGFKMYVNGTLEKTGNLSENNGALISGVAQPLQLLGKGPLVDSSDSSAFKGYMKNIRFYDKVLSQSEVSTIHTNMLTNEYIDTMNYISQNIPNVVVSSIDISSGDHTELAQISMKITSTSNSSLNISATDISYVNGGISNFTSDSTTWSFTFTPTTKNERSKLYIPADSLLNNVINNMTDKPSWFSNHSNYASNVFEFITIDISLDLMPPLEDQTIPLITSNGQHIELDVSLNGDATYDPSLNEYDVSGSGYLSVDDELIRDGDLTISMMYCMKSGNQHGNDQLVNITDNNYLDTSINSTDIHVFRDGTTPGAWFYYGSPDDNAMAISEAGLSSSTKYTHMAITVKEGNVKQFYIDGEPVDYVNKYRSDNQSVTRTVIGGKRQYQLFGYGYARNIGFTGLMKNIRFYNKALEPSEIQNLYLVNTNYNDNNRTGVDKIPIERPSLTLSPNDDISYGSSLNQSTLDFTLTASNNSLDGNVEASHIIVTNGSITSFSQISPSSWGMTFTSDYNQGTTRSTLMVEQDSIYNSDVNTILTSSSPVWWTPHHNQVSNTFVWSAINSSQDTTNENNSESSDAIPCFLKGTQILTTTGYKNIEDLTPMKDKLVDKDNKSITLIEMQKYYKTNDGTHYPKRIPKNTRLSDKYVCTKDLYLTQNHCVYLPKTNQYAPVSCMKKIEYYTDSTQECFTYYHIFTENYFSDTIIANGIPCESHGKYTFKKLYEVDTTGMLLKKIIRDVKMKPNCIRNHISNKRYKKMVEKYKISVSSNNRHNC